MLSRVANSLYWMSRNAERAENNARILDVQLLQMIERSEEHTSELQSPVPISYAVFCLKKKKKSRNQSQDARKHFS